MNITHLLLAGLLAGMVDEPVRSAPVDSAVRVRQLTTGPSHHYFGYIGQCRTIPWNASGRYLLALETDFQDRLPGAGDAARVCLIDTPDGNRVRVLDRSLGWNPQQGTMFYWNPEHPETQFFSNHTLNNRNNDLIYFFCRADFHAKTKQVNVPFTVRPDGSELTAHPTFIGGHPDWEWGSRIIGSADHQQVIYDAATRQIVQKLGGAEVFPDPGGDISLAPDGRWFVNSHREGEYNHYTFLDRRTGRVRRSPPVFMRTWAKGDLRLDPAPCWNRTGDAIVVPGIAPDGTRQMFVLELEASGG